MVNAIKLRLDVVVHVTLNRCQVAVTVTLCPPHPVHAPEEFSYVTPRERFCVPLGTLIQTEKVIVVLL